MTNRIHVAALLVVVPLALVAGPGTATAAPFVRGDVNADGAINLTDPTVLLQFLFQGGSEPSCLAAADVNATGDLDLSDGIYLLLFLFANGQSPQAPYPDCGEDGGTVSCAVFPPCAPVDEIVTRFAGGSLTDLRELNAQLSFDHLIIEGPLDLPLNSSSRLNVNRLTITAAGSIRRSRGPCDYRPGPTLFVRAEGGRVVIDGDIRLTGVSGTRALDTATCDSCTGTAGGRVDIIASQIEIGAAVDVSGGTGSTGVSTAVSNCSTGCAGGDGGSVRLEADVLDLTGSDIVAVAGDGGSGRCQGQTSTGADGAPGSVKLLGGDVLMNGGGVRTDGVLTLRADRTEIFGALEGSLAETIGGAPDDEPPVIEIISPTNGGTVSLSAPLGVQVRLGDTGAGVRDLHVTGLGQDGPVSISGVQNGIFTLPPFQALPPPTLEITARDNAGHTSTQTVDQLSFVGDLMLSAGQSLTLSEALVLPAGSAVAVAGRLVLKNGVDHSIEAGSLTIAPTGSVVLEEETDAPGGKAPSLEIALRESATIAGTIDLTGRSGTPTTNAEQGGEDGGDLTCIAGSISVTGSLRSGGGPAVSREVFENQFGRVRIAAPGGAGGLIALIAEDDVTVSGAVAFEGGPSINTGFGGCFDGGPGGAVFVSFGGEASFDGGTFEASGGFQGGPFSFTCGIPLLGSPGNVAVEYTGGGEFLLPVVEIEEREPNATPITAHGLPVGALTVVHGRASPSDDAGERIFSINIDHKGVPGRPDEFEDLYLIRLLTTRRILMTVDPALDQVDLDLYLFDYRTTSLIGGSNRAGGQTDGIEGTLGAGVYVLAVSWWDLGANTGSDYTLVILAD